MNKFNRVFFVTPDAGKYLLLQESALEMAIQQQAELYVLDGSPKLDSWLPVAVDWLVVPDEPLLEKPDIAAWGATGLVVPEVIAEELKPTLSICCEFLPMDLKGERFFALHILAKEEAIDKNLTIMNMRNGKPSRIQRFKKLVLDSSKIIHGGLFKVAGAGIGTFCTDEEGGLYDLVQKYGWTGLNFTEVEFS